MKFVEHSSFLSGYEALCCSQSDRQRPRGTGIVQGSLRQSDGGASLFTIQGYCGTSFKTTVVRFHCKRVLQKLEQTKLINDLFQMKTAGKSIFSNTKYV